MTAISRNKVSIYIVDADVDASALAATDKITGEIKTYAKSGGAQEIESDPVFGGFVDKEKPREQVEVSWEIIPSLEDADRWDAMAYSVDTTGVYTMADETSTLAVDKAVYIEAVDGSKYKSLGFNNCSVTVLDMEHSADDNRTYNMTMKFSPSDGSGVSNFMTLATATANLPDWSELDNN